MVEETVLACLRALCYLICIKTMFMYIYMFVLLSVIYALQARESPIRVTMSQCIYW